MNNGNTMIARLQSTKFDPATITMLRLKSSKLGIPMPALTVVATAMKSGQFVSKLGENKPLLEKYMTTVLLRYVST